MGGYLDILIALLIIVATLLLGISLLHFPRLLSILRPVWMKVVEYAHSLFKKLERKRSKKKKNSSDVLEEGRRWRTTVTETREHQAPQASAGGAGGSGNGGGRTTEDEDPGEDNKPWFKEKAPWQSRLSFLTLVFAWFAYSIPSFLFLWISFKEEWWAGVIFVLTSFVLPIVIIGGIYVCASLNIIWTIVKEGQSKPVLRNGELVGFIMNFQGRRFYHEFQNQSDEVKTAAKAWLKKKRGGYEVPDGELFHPWNVIDLDEAGIGYNTEKFEFLDKLDLFKNIYFIGIPPANEVLEYEFPYATLEQRVVNGKVSMRVVMHGESGTRDYISLQENVYAVSVNNAETGVSENEDGIPEFIPLDLTVAVTMHVFNPYKALFRVEESFWLEKTIDQIIPGLKGFVGSSTYHQVVAEVSSSSKRIKQFLDDEDDPENSVIGRLLWEWGVSIDEIQIQEVEPSTSQGEEFIRAFALPAIANKKAEAVRIEADATNYRISKELSAYQEYGELGATAVQWNGIRDTKLDTLVMGGAIPAVPVGGKKERTTPHEPEHQP